MDKNLLYKYFKGEASPSERKAVRTWVEASADHYDEYIRERKLFDASLLLSPREVRSPLKARLLRLGRMAAAAAAVFALGVLFQHLNTRPEEGLMQRIIVPMGQRVNLQLADGTDVWLNSGSEFTYSTTFSKSDRRVMLDGEGYFKVAKDARHPFRIETACAAVEVLGTEFDVINYAEFATTEAILCNGSIRAYGGRLPAPVTLKPGDRLVFDRKEGRASRSRVSTRNYSQWMGGSLSFDDTSLADILTNLERWYAVEIDAPEAWTRQVRMSFKLIRNESIEEILKAMSLVVEMDYVGAGRRITIIPKQPKNS